MVEVTWTNWVPPDLLEKNESIIVQKKQVKWYNLPMKKNVLSQTNPYVRDKKQRLSGLIISVGSSSAIEGIPANQLIQEYLRKKKIFATVHNAKGNV